MSNTRHDYYEMLISQYLDGELNDIEEQKELEKHLLECKKCQKTKKEFESLSAILSGENLNIKKTLVLHKNHFPILKMAASIVILLTISIASFTYLNKQNNTGMSYATTGQEKSQLVAETLSSYIETENYYVYDSEEYSPLGTYFAYIDE